MTRLDQLKALRDAVRDNAATLSDIQDMCIPIWPDGQDHWKHLAVAFSARRKNTNGALALLEALLPESTWDLWCNRLDGQVGCNLDDIDTVYAPDPARALLLAVLEALIAKEEG